MTDFSRLGVAAIRDGVAKGEFKAVEVAEALNTRVAAAKALNAFIIETPEKAIEAAQAVDADRAAGKSLGKMAGVPIGMKDLFCTEGVQTTAASHILEGFVPTYEFDRVREPVEGRGRDARQAQYGPVRDGLVERDQLFRQCDFALAAE